MEEISEEDSNLALQLLEAIWQIFAEKKVVRMHTKALLQALVNIEEAPWEEANNGREIDGTGCGKSSRGSCRGPQIPKRRRRSAVPANGGRGKARPSRATRRTICAKPGGATSTARRRARQPKRPAPRTAPAAIRGGSPNQPIRRPTDDEGDAGLAADGADENGGKDHASGERAQQGGANGPARRRTRPSEAEAVGEA